jgi:hypothetical protein
MDIFGEDEPTVKPVSSALRHPKVQDLDFLPLDFSDTVCIVEPFASGFRLVRTGLRSVRGVVRLVRGYEQLPRGVVQPVIAPGRS